MEASEAMVVFAASVDGEQGAEPAQEPFAVIGDTKGNISAGDVLF